MTDPNDKLLQDGEWLEQTWTEGNKGDDDDE